MVQPIENEARVYATVRRVQPKGRKDYVDLVVDVDAVEDVEGRANLLRDRVGQEVTITTDADLVSTPSLVPGDRVVIDAELRGPGAIWSRPGAVKRA